jgi:hypothetical protein
LSQQRFAATPEALRGTLWRTPQDAGPQAAQRARHRQAVEKQPAGRSRMYRPKVDRVGDRLRQLETSIASAIDSGNKDADRVSD